jgi:hypothetical protein
MPADYIAYEEGLITSCEAALRQHWRRPKVSLTRRPKGSRGTFYCHLDPDIHADAVWEQKSNAAMPLPVLPIHPFNPANSFLFGVRLRFDHEYESTHALTSASLYVFAGMELAPIVRAEWDRRDVGNTQHAQPHWHLLGNQGYLRPESNDSDIIDFVPSQRAPLFETDRIHFPMNAAWQLNASAASCQHRFAQRDDLVNWIVGLTKYLGDQLSYVAAKTPFSPVQTPAVPFEPGRSA